MIPLWDPSLEKLCSWSGAELEEGSSTQPCCQSSSPHYFGSNLSSPFAGIDKPETYIFQISNSYSFMFPTYHYKEKRSMTANEAADAILFDG